MRFYKTEADVDFDWQLLKGTQKNANNLKRYVKVFFFRSTVLFIEKIKKTFSRS